MKLKLAVLFVFLVASALLPMIAAQLPLDFNLPKSQLDITHLWNACVNFVYPQDPGSGGGGKGVT